MRFIQFGHYCLPGDRQRHPGRAAAAEGSDIQGTAENTGNWRTVGANRQHIQKDEQLVVTMSVCGLSVHQFFGISLRCLCEMLEAGFQTMPVH